MALCVREFSAEGACLDILIRAAWDWALVLLHPLSCTHSWLLNMSEEQTKHLVIIGCSHAGLGLIDKLRGKLPQGWKVTVVEPNTHFHWQM